MSGDPIGQEDRGRYCITVAAMVAVLALCLALRGSLLWERICPRETRRRAVA